MVKYNLKYKPGTIGSQNKSTYDVILTKKQPKEPNQPEETVSITLYDVFKIVRNIFGVYVSVYILGSVDKYISKIK